MKYYIGMDGGGTKTKCVLTDENLNVLHECTGGPSTFLLVGTDQVSETLFTLVNESRKEAGISFDDIEAVVLGTSGAGRRNDAETMENAFMEYAAQKGARIKRFFVESDARVALEGAFSGNPGSILISGTGTAMFGKDAKGGVHRVGGFGRFIGDEGSGYMIGRKALMASAKCFDGRGSWTMIKDMIEDKFGINDQAVLITEIYRNKFDIASVTPLAVQAAEKGDDVAIKIMEEESHELILHTKAMFKKLDQKVMKLSLIGGTITTDNYFARLFRKKVDEYMPGVEIIEPEYPPQIGAVLMGKSL